MESIMFRKARLRRDGAKFRWIAIFSWKAIAVSAIVVLVYLRIEKPSDCLKGRFRRELNQNESEISSTISPSTIFIDSTANNSLTNGTESPGGDIYPPNLLNDEQIKNGGFLLFALGLFYMFCALAIVCDEFFVPALEILTIKMAISDDVAGATMMAAGGSAPELFTSIIGVFFAKSDVGIGTIVGSAVFNVLFVIGMCAMFSIEVLQLTWWPLFRDCSFYILSLLVLIIGFYDQQIYWYESLALLCVYAAYVIFMKFNERVEKYIKSLSCINGDSEQISVKVCPLTDEAKKQDSNGVSSVDHSDDTKTPSKQTSQESGTNSFHSTGWRIAANRVTTLKREEEMSTDFLQADQNGVLQAPPREKFTTFAQVSDTVLREQRAYRYNRCRHRCSIRTLMKVSNPKLTRQAFERTQTMVDLKESQSGKPVQKKQGRSISIDDKDSRATTNGNDVTHVDFPNGSIETKRNASHETLAMPPITEESAANDLTKSNNSVPGETESSEGSEADYLDMSWPKGDWKKQLIYLFFLGITGPLYLLVPDVRREGNEKYVVLTFINSIIAIGVYSYLMVWFATILGTASGIPIEVMGLTFLAAGTSVPDLITSVIVAKKGLGDMAVSSSIGSNIFDVTIGLPFPWFIMSLIQGAPVKVVSKGMFCSIGLLFLMLIAVFVSIACYKWRMTKGLGMAMFLLYGVFLAVTLVIQMDNAYGCPW